MVNANFLFGLIKQQQFPFLRLHIFYFYYFGFYNYIVKQFDKIQLIQNYLNLDQISKRMEGQQQYDPDMPDDDDLPEMGKKSSLRERQDPNLPVIVNQLFNVKRGKLQNGNSTINQYEIIQPLGRGAFGQVFKIRKLESENKFSDYAMKVYNVMALKKQRFFAPDMDFADGLDMLDNQLNIIKRLNHKNITAFYQILHTSQKVYLVNQLCVYGQIMNWNQLTQNYVRNPKVVSYIKQKYQVTDIVDITKIIFAQVCAATKYMHDLNITNRDIKVDNILCTEASSKFQEIKITDFTTIRYSNDDISYFPSGTPGFRGPQHQFATSQGYSSKASDIWSIGISLYTFFYQKFPFYGQSQLEVDIKAKNQQLKFDESCPKWLINIIQKMSAKQWKDRITIDEAIKLLTQN